MNAQIDLHGAEVLYLPDQTAPITVGPSSIVGLVGAATNAQAAVAAKLAVGQGNAGLTFTAAAQVAALIARLEVGAGNAGLEFAADAAGAAGNTITVALADPGANSSPLTVAVAGRDITVSLATGNAGAITSTGAEVLAAVNAHAGASALVTAADAAGSDGTGTVAAHAKTALAGGADARPQGGVAGNGITLELFRPNLVSQALSVAVEGRNITVSLATDADGAVHTTGAALVAAWATQAYAAARALVAIASSPGSDGSATLSPVGRTALAGGMDEPFPLNTPTAIRNAAHAAQLGTAGSLPEAIADVWRTAGRGGATIVVVRTADDTAANIIGSRAAGAYTGVYALLAAEARTGLKPRLIAAPALQTTAAALALEAAADKLRAIPVVALAGADYSAALASRSSLAHAYCVWPKFKVFDAAAGTLVDRWAAALTVGHIVRVDGEESYAASPSNRQLQDVAGTSVAIDWQIDGRTSTANLLSRAFIVTAIRRGNGLYLWGNRLADGELITHRRVRHLIGDALLSFVADWIDRNVDVPFVEFILDRMNSFLRGRTLAGIITGGRAWFDAEYNTPETLEANQVTFSFDCGLHAVAEQLTFRQSVSGVYNARIIEQLTGA